jgi:LmbE family N-acetylglucosaminyl deacetylase
MEKRAVVFAPHPDDETLGCGGTIARKLSEGYDISVVFLTDGRHSLAELGMFSSPTPFEMKEIRREDAMRATKILGLREKDLVFLVFEDKTLRKHEKLVQERIVEILKDISPVEVFFPQAKEYNIDHRVTNILIRRAIEKLDVHPVEYQYIIAWKFPLYLLVHVTNERIFDLMMSKVLEGDLIHVDISKFLDLKQMAIKEYKSQIAVLSDRQKRPALKNSFIKRFLKNQEKFFVHTLSV